MAVEGGGCRGGGSGRKKHRHSHELGTARGAWIHTRSGRGGIQTLSAGTDAGVGLGEVGGTPTRIGEARRSDLLDFYSAVARTSKFKNREWLGVNFL